MAPLGLLVQWPRLLVLLGLSALLAWGLLDLLLLLVHRLHLLGLVVLLGQLLHHLRHHLEGHVALLGQFPHESLCLLLL